MGRRPVQPPPPWWHVSRWQAFTAGLLMALSFLAVWVALTQSYMLTNYTVHPPGEVVPIDGGEVQVVGLYTSKMLEGNGGSEPAPPGMSHMMVTLKVTPTSGDLYCNSMGLIDVDQKMSWKSSLQSVKTGRGRSCYDLTESGKTQIVNHLFLVPTNQVDRIGGVVIEESTWRSISEVVR